MNPGEFFDYLDGKLSSSERAELEARLAADANLRRELDVAREIYSGIARSRSALDELESPAQNTRGAVLGRRIAIIFGVLVFLNVLFGIYAIWFMNKKRSTPNEQNRQQLNQALQNAAASALPTPNLDVDEIKIPAANDQRDAVAAKVVAAASECGGSAAKNISNENGLLVFAEIPAANETKFREKLTTFGALPSKTEPNPSSANRIIQIRIIEESTH